MPTGWTGVSMGKINEGHDQHLSEHVVHQSLLRFTLCMVLHGSLNLVSLLMLIRLWLNMLLCPASTLWIFDFGRYSPLCYKRVQSQPF